MNPSLSFHLINRSKEVTVNARALLVFDIALQEVLDTGALLACDVAFPVIVDTALEGVLDTGALLACDIALHVFIFLGAFDVIARKYSICNLYATG
jgi:hypothetical protein